MFSIPGRSMSISDNASQSFAIWITGLPASGKSAITAALVNLLKESNNRVTVLESDILRTFFTAQPRYDKQEREYFYGSMAFIGKVLTDCGISVIFDATANLRSYRDRARREIRNFIEVYVDTPLAV